MLPKSYRLPAGEKFENPKSFSNEFFRVFAKPNTFSNNRFGFVVSKKIDKRAVVRNRLKRVLREAVSEFLSTEKSLDVLFIVKKSFVDEPTGAVVERVQTALNKLL